MSTGSTQSFFSISRIRVSAEIGRANSTRSTRVRRANSTMSSTLPSLRAPAQVSSARLSLRSSNTPSTWMSESSCAFSASTSCSPLRSEPTMMVRRSSRPWRAQLRTSERSTEALGDQRSEAEEVEGGEPQPRHFAAELGEERGADEQQEDERPGRDHPRQSAGAVRGRAAPDRCRRPGSRPRRRRRRRRSRRDNPSGRPVSGMT